MRGSVRLFATLVAMVAASAMPIPAQAAQFLYTVSGTVLGEEWTYDEWHVFDPEQNEGFIAEFLVDDAAPLALYSYGATASSATGGAMVQFGSRAPVSAKLTIGTSTYAIRTGDYHSYPTFDPVGDPFGDPIGPTDITEELGSIAKDASLGKLMFSVGFGTSHSCCWPHPNDSYGESEFIEFYLDSGAFTDPDYRQTGTFAVNGGGYFGKSETIVASPGYLTQIILHATSLTVVSTSAVPEIGNWLIMILGIGSIGFCARQSQARVPLRAVASARRT